MLRARATVRYIGRFFFGARAFTRIASVWLLGYLGFVSSFLSYAYVRTLSTFSTDI